MPWQPSPWQPTSARVQCWPMAMSSPCNSHSLVHYRPVYRVHILSKHWTSPFSFSSDDATSCLATVSCVNAVMQVVSRDRDRRQSRDPLHRIIREHFAALYYTRQQAVIYDAGMMSDDEGNERGDSCSRRGGNETLCRGDSWDRDILADKSVDVVNVLHPVTVSSRRFVGPLLSWLSWSTPDWTGLDWTGHYRVVKELQCLA